MTQILGITRASKTVYGAGYIVLGLTWLLLPTQSRLAGIGWVGWLTPGMVGAAWILAGTFALTVALQPKRLQRLTTAVWLTLTALPGVLALYFLVAWVGFLLPWVTGGAERVIASAASYIVIAAGAAGMSRVSQVAHRVQSRWEEA